MRGPPARKSRQDPRACDMGFGRYFTQTPETVNASVDRQPRQFDGREIGVPY